MVRTLERINAQFGYRMDFSNPAIVAAAASGHAIGTAIGNACADAWAARSLSQDQGQVMATGGHAAVMQRGHWK